MLLKSCLVIIFLLFFECVFAQTEVRFYDSTKSIYTDYVVNYSDSISVSLLSSGKYSKFEITSDLQNIDESKTLQFAPNTSTALGVGFDYKWLGFSLSFSLPKSQASYEKFGHTDQVDFQTNIYLRKFIFDLNFTSYKGYYVENPLEFDTTWNRKLPYPQRKDIQTASLGAGFNYVKNSEKFSYKAAYTTTERQKKSAGSFIFGGFFSIYALYADSNVVAYANNYSFSDSAKIVSATVFSIGGSAGYTYTFAWKRYYLNLSFVPGIAYQNSDLAIKNNNIISKSGLNVKTMGRFAMGYSGDFYYWGIALVTDNYQLKNSTTSQFQYSFRTAKFFFGWRFGYKRLKARFS